MLCRNASFRQTLNWPAARTVRVLFAENVFLTLGPLKLLGRAETAKEAVAAAIADICVVSVPGNAITSVGFLYAGSRAREVFVPHLFLQP